MDGLERTTEFNSTFIEVWMGQQGHRDIEGSRWVVVGAPRRECGRESGLFRATLRDGVVDVPGPHDARVKG